MKFITRSICFVLSILCIGALSIVVDGLHDNVKKSDAIVILGNKVDINGIPSATLKSRLDKGLELYNTDISHLIIVSGGLGKEGFEEAEVMRDYLVAKGVESGSIVVDNDGLDTFMTAQNTKRILLERKLSSVIVVSNYFHISRIRLAFNKTGIDKVYSAHANYFWTGDVRSIPREVIAYIYYLFRKY